MWTVFLEKRISIKISYSHRSHGLPIFYNGSRAGSRWITQITPFFITLCSSWFAFYEYVGGQGVCKYFSKGKTSFCISGDTCTYLCHGHAIPCAAIPCACVSAMLYLQHTFNHVQKGTSISPPPPVAMLVERCSVSPTPDPPMQCWLGSYWCFCFAGRLVTSGLYLANTTLEWGAG